MKKYFYLFLVQIFISQFFMFANANSANQAAFQVSKSSFEKENFKLVFTKYGMGFELNNSVIYFSLQNKKWCYFENRKESNNCNLDKKYISFGASLESSKKIATGTVDKNNEGCFLIFSTDELGNKDITQSYLQICDESNLEFSARHMPQGKISAQLIFRKNTYGVIEFNTSIVAIAGDGTLESYKSRSMASIDQKFTPMPLWGHHIFITNSEAAQIKTLR